MASPQLEMVKQMLRAGATLGDVDFPILRANLETLTTSMPLPEDVGRESTAARGVPAEWSDAPGHDAKRAILYLHGGGYCIGSIATHRRLAGELGRAAGSRVLSLDYRLGPEHPYPAAVEDAVAGYHFLLDQGFAPGRIGIAGDSAGGGLTVATLLALRDSGTPLPAGAATLSPWLDLTQSGDSQATKAAEDPMVQKAQLDRFAAAYLGASDASAPHASPLFADLTGLPPILVHVGTAEVLLDDSLRFGERARAAGADVEVEVYEDMIHVWHAFEAFLPEARDALAKLGAFFRRVQAD